MRRRGGRRKIRLEEWRKENETEKEQRKRRKRSRRKGRRKKRRKRREGRMLAGLPCKRSPAQPEAK